MTTVSFPLQYGVFSSPSFDRNWSVALDGRLSRSELDEILDVLESYWRRYHLWITVWIHISFILNLGAMPWGLLQLAHHARLLVFISLYNLTGVLLFLYEMRLVV